MIKNPCVELFLYYRTGILRRITGNINALKYTTEVIHDIKDVGKCLVFPQRSCIFQYDMVPPHRAKLTKEFLRKKKVEVLPRPGNSPDLNPLENLWAILKNRLHMHTIHNSHQLWDAIQLEWYGISAGICKNLLTSMLRRLKLVLKHKGFPTKY